MPEPVNLATFEDDIISACAKHEPDQRAEYVSGTLRGHRRSLRQIQQFLWPHFQMQTYVFQRAKLDMSSPHVPEFFHQDYQVAYVVTEYITLTPLPVLDFLKCCHELSSGFAIFQLQPKLNRTCQD